MAGHDEDPAKAAMGTPLERIIKMGSAMLEAVRAFKPPSCDGKKFEIRLGQLTAKTLRTPSDISTPVSSFPFFKESSLHSSPYSSTLALHLGCSTVSYVS